MKSETLSFKNIINELHLPQKTAIIQRNIRKKGLQLFAIKLKDEIPDPSNSKEHYQSFITKKTLNEHNNQKYLLSIRNFLKTQTLLM